MSDEYDDTKKSSADGWQTSAPGFQMKPQTGSSGDGKASIKQDINTVEDWAMSQPTVEVPEIEKNPKEWKMPEPVFRVSSGKTLKKSDETTPIDLPRSKDISLEKNLSATTIQPQPLIPEEITVSETAKKPPAKPESKGFKTIFIVLAFAAMIIFAVAFLVAVYFLFFYNPNT